MDLREKLVELLKENCHLEQKCPGECTGCMADHLIENGVTVQEWIPVTERLPEKSGYYLYRADSPYRGLQNGVGVSYYQHKSKIWKKVYNPCVTHWMPLPEPPKES